MNGPALRVLLTLDAVGGVWQYGLDLARGLSARGVESVLAVLGPSPAEDQRREARAIAGATMVETGLALDWLCDGPAPIRVAGKQIAEMARDLDIDAVQFNMPTLAAERDRAVPALAVTHGCVSTWWEAARPGEPLAAQFGWHRDLMGQGLRAADRIVAPTAGYARTIERHYALPDPVRVVHNGRTPIAEPGEQPPARRVLTVGRLWDRVKRADLLDRVAARLDVPFDAAGAAVAPHGETASLPHLRLAGQLDTRRLADRLRERPVFVSAASFEPFGLAVLEAAQAGCALVLSDIGTFRELWDGAALFVPPENETAYVRAITALLDDPELRLRIGDAARERARRYAPQAMADAMLALYREALAAGTLETRGARPQGRAAA